MATVPLKTTTLRCSLICAGHDRTEPKKRGQVEDVRPEDDPGANGGLVVHQCGDGGRDFGCVGSQGSHHPEQGFGEAEALADPLETRDEHPACRQADDRPDDEGQSGNPKFMVDDVPALNDPDKMRKLNQARRHASAPERGPSMCRPDFPALRAPAYPSRTASLSPSEPPASGGDPSAIGQTEEPPLALAERFLSHLG